MKTVSRYRLDSLLAKALDRRQAYEKAVRNIELALGVDVDELGLSDEEVVEFTAEVLLELVRVKKG